MNYLSDASELPSSQFRLDVVEQMIELAVWQPGEGDKGRFVRLGLFPTADEAQAAINRFRDQFKSRKAAAARAVAKERQRRRKEGQPVGVNVRRPLRPQENDCEAEE